MTTTFNTSLNKDLAETICDKCEGSGSIPPNVGINNPYYSKCKNCDGTGKLDWLEVIVGKRKNKFKEFENNMLDAMAKQIADEIDKDILRSLMDDLEQNKNVKGE